MQIPIVPEPFQSVSGALTQIIAYFTSTPINAGLTGVLLLSLFWLFYVPHPLGEDFTPPVSQARQRLDTSSAYTALPLDHSKSIEFVSYTPKTLALFDGTGSEQSPDGSKILLAINGKVFDVSSGRNFYGPGGPYGNFAGRDASRGMAKQSFDLSMLTPLDQPIDTLEDLTDSERASEKLFRDAEAEEDAEELARAKMRRAQRVSEPVWTGEERIEDTVLRMLEHKYKPLRRGEDGRTAEKKRLEQVPRPTVRPRTAQDEVGANGVLIRRTGDNPWDLFYSAQPKKESRVYRGRADIDLKPPGSEMKQQLDKMGMSAQHLPRDDPKAMGKIRDTLRSSAVRDRIKTAVDKSIRYPDRMKPVRPTDAEEEGESTPLLGVVSTAKGMAGIAEMKIEEALRKGTFQNNSLRGKPIPYDYNEGNAHLGREEFLLNRMVRRQNAAPPFVEMNMDMKNEERALRQRIQAAWICRALIRLEQSGAWRRMEPVAVAWEEDDSKPSELPAYTLDVTSDAQRTTVAWARGFRDAQWVQEQAAYHAAAVQQLNQVIRRYNHIAPYFARRLLYTKESFVQDALDRAFPLLVEAASARLRGMRATGPAAAPAPTSERPRTSWWAWIRGKAT
ncbi:hypothetical protein MBRA1_002819 [Malassezia brasiliensis]|uniref:Cytochrome b5 heme-binding domain-containing protein n=1 Tax=Malassezia brasiliensis TaxID=1821822 RepID=A0AAF0DU68_9BASI|nr:hypothetical protein MBRA1_002819 [Malassezia brasiliensis]